MQAKYYILSHPMSQTLFVAKSKGIQPLIRAVRCHPKFAYHDTIVLASRYTLGIDILHDMAYMT